ERGADACAPAPPLLLSPLDGYAFGAPPRSSGLVAERRGRRSRRLGRDRVLAVRAIAAEHLLQVLDVDVKVVQVRLEVVPLAVQQAAEERAVAVGNQRLVLDVDLAVEVQVALEDADGDGHVATDRGETAVDGAQRRVAEDVDQLAA